MTRRRKKKQKQPFMNWLISQLQNIKLRRWLLYIVLLSLTGQFINIFWNDYFPQFTIHQLLLIIATTMLVYAMRGFFNETDALRQSFAKGVFRNTELRNLMQQQFQKWQQSKIPLLLGSIIVAFFFGCIVRLEYIRIDAVGLYAIYIGGSSVLLGVFGYCQYLLFLRMIHKINSMSITDYDIYSPADTGWVVQIAKTSRRLRNYFLAIGLIYVVEYGILIPMDKISFGESVSLSTPDNFVFVFSWAALFLLVIIAFPILNAVQHRLIANIVVKMKNISINELSELMYAEKKASSSVKEKLTNTVVYNVLIMNVRQSKNYPIKRQLSFEVIMTTATLIVHLFNLYSKISQFPWLNDLLPQL